MAIYYLLHRYFDIGNKVPKNQDFGKRLKIRSMRAVFASKTYEIDMVNAIQM